MTPDELDEEATQAEHDRTASWLAIGQGADLWYGRDNVRMVDGSKPNTTFWKWLTS